jgi:RNA polymerase sigma-70 factor, ECF subfamily
MENVGVSTVSVGRISALTVRTPDEEGSLIRRVREGETDIFYELISPYERLIYVAARSILRNHADAEEAAQEAYLKALVHLSTFRKESKFSTWLLQIAVNEARSKRRKDRRSFYQSLDENTQDEDGTYYPREWADWRETPSEALLRADLRQSLLNAIGSLDHAYHEVFVMRDVQRRSIAETAEVLQISAALVKTRLLRARLKLRNALAPAMDISCTTGDSTWRQRRA